MIPQMTANAEFEQILRQRGKTADCSFNIIKVLNPKQRYPENIWFKDIKSNYL